ncbi:MAG: hypothetical protein HZB53_09335 [Chloroflexi bacterium]|nr:hypothetical protein [Chloroflexota bacterium]
MSAWPQWLYRLTSLACGLALLLAMLGCDEARTPAPAGSDSSPAAPAAQSAAPPAQVTTPGAAGAGTFTTPAAATTCTVPAFSEQIALTSLPGTVRYPRWLAMLNDRLYVTNRVSNSLAVVEAEKLTQIVPLNAAPSLITADERAGRLYVMNENERSISLLEGTQLRATLPISNPRLASYQQFGGMALDAVRNRLYAVVTGDGSAIAVIDTQRFTITRWIALTGWRTATRLGLDPSGQELYLAGYDRIEVIDLALGVVVRAVPLPTSSYSVFALDPQTGRVFVDQYDNGEYIAVVENGQVVTRIPVGASANSALVVGRRLYVSASSSSTVSVIDIDSLRTLATVSVGSQPAALASDARGEKVYVAIEGAYGREAGRIDVIDTRTLAVVRLIPLMAQPTQLLADETRGRLYALMPSSSELLISDGRRVLASVPLERSPAQMALDEQAGRIYVSDWETGAVTVIDAANARVLERRALAKPYRTAIAVDAQNRRLIVNNRAFALDTLAPAGGFTLTGYTMAYGDGITPSWLLANPASARIYAIASNGVPGSNGGLILYGIDSLALRQVVMSGERNVAGVALDSASDSIFVAANHPMAGTTKLFNFRAANLAPISALPAPTRISALAINPRTRHLFVAYGDSYFSAAPPNPLANQIDVLDARTLGRVATIPVSADPSVMAVLGDRLFIAHASGRTLTVIHDCVGSPPPAPTPTLTPTPYPTLPPVATQPPTPTPSPTPRQAPTAISTPTPVASCPLPMASWVRAADDSTFDIQANLGCPAGPPSPLRLAKQAFQNGAMVWREDTRTIYVILDSGTWLLFNDTWDAGQPEGGTERPPASELRAPKRGFGKVWREQLGGATAALGWAVEDERAVSGEVQMFERGQALREGTGAAYRLMNSGSWK